MNDSNKLGTLARVILALPILLCVTISVYTVYQYERCLMNPDTCKSIVISLEEERSEELESGRSEELERGKEILEEYEKQQKTGT